MSICDQFCGNYSVHFSRLFLPNCLKKSAKGTFTEPNLEKNGRMVGQTVVKFAWLFAVDGVRNIQPRTACFAKHLLHVLCIRLERPPFIYNQSRPAACWRQHRWLSAGFRRPYALPNKGAPTSTLDSLTTPGFHRHVGSLAQHQFLCKTADLQRGGNLLVVCQAPQANSYGHASPVVPDA